MNAHRFQRPSVHVLAWPTVAMLAVLPRAADACAVCGIGRDDETRTAFILTTGFMTFLPLMIIGGAVWWLRRRARELADRPTAPAIPGPLAD